MGNSASGDASHQHDNDDDPFDGADTLGYRVLGVQPNSPASKAGLVSFLDFLVGASGKMLLGSGEDLEEGEEYDDVDLPALLKENVNQQIEFLVYNIKSGDARLVKLMPEEDWGGAGLLGVTIRLDNYAGAEERLIRVLTVEAKSPAAVAGLVPEKDFILGTTHQTLDSSDALAELLHQNVDQVVEFYVYNTDSDLVRTVVLMPTLSWGGNGLLGAEVATGYLHRLPHHARATDGASVERKVRYVQQPQQQQSKGTTSGNGDTPAAVEAQSNGGETTTITTKTVLEYEPQLEMEPAEESPVPPPKQVAAPAAAAATTTSTKTSAPPAVSPTAKGSLAKGAATCPLPPPPNPPAASPGGVELNAKDVFARPPQQGVPPQLPPPPKMIYDSPTRR